MSLKNTKIIGLCLRESSVPLGKCFLANLAKDISPNTSCRVRIRAPSDQPFVELLKNIADERAAKATDKKRQLSYISLLSKNSVRLPPDSLTRVLDTWILDKDTGAGKERTRFFESKAEQNIPLEEAKAMYESSMGSYARTRKTGQSNFITLRVNQSQKDQLRTLREKEADIESDCSQKYFLIKRIGVLTTLILIGFFILLAVHYVEWSQLEKDIQNVMNEIIEDNQDIIMQSHLGQKTESNSISGTYSQPVPEKGETHLGNYLNVLRREKSLRRSQKKARIPRISVSKHQIQLTSPPGEKEPTSQDTGIALGDFQYFLKNYLRKRFTLH